MADGMVANFIGDVLATRNVEDIEHVIDMLCNAKDVPISVSKEAMKIVGKAVDLLNDIKGMAQLVGKIVQSTNSNQSAYEETIVMVHEKAAAKYEASGCKREAAEELIRLYEFINEVRSAQEMQKSVEYLRRRVDLCIHSARLLVEIGDVENAGNSLVLASDKVVNMPSGDRSVLNYKLLNAKLLDLRHDFIHAAQKYGELLRNSALPLEERRQCLLFCAQSTILAEAGPERSSVLRIIIKDEQSASLACYPILKKLYSQQILRPDDIAAAQSILQEHQKVALPGEKMTPLARAVMMHNLFSAANVYASIRLNELGQLLGISEDEAETVASDMIRQNRISAKIDQVERLLHFNCKQDPLAAWDRHIEYMCNTADEAADMIKHKSEDMA